MKGRRGLAIGLLPLALLGACSGSSPEADPEVAALRRQVDALMTRVESLQREQMELKREMRALPPADLVDELPLAEEETELLLQAGEEEPADPELAQEDARTNARARRSARGRRRTRER